MGFQDRQYGSGGHDPSGGYGGGSGVPGFAFPRLTPAVKVILIANVVVFFVNAIFAGALGDYLGFAPAGAFEWLGVDLVRLVTYQFVHSYASIWHIVFNMLIVYFFGTFVEEVIGTRRFWWLYLVSGVVGALLHTLLHWGSTIPLIGASGAVYGVMMYCTLMAPMMRVIFIIFPIRLWVITGFFVFVGVYQTILEFRHDVESGTAHSAHVGGAIWGAVVYWIARSHFDTSRWNPLRKLGQWRQQRRFQAGHKRQAVLDQILEKVHREGLGALTAAEKRFLERASKDMKD
ncbi:MAG: rhomboid family intramembrane serine protease [Planctomycetota bacterium]|jgi:membrane associated rhomboid family serine protease